MAKHTAGPWTFEVNANSVDVFLGPVKRGAEVFRQRLYGGEDHDMDAVAIADARLIAACPTMYDYIRRQAEEGDGDAAKIISAID